MKKSILFYFRLFTVISSTLFVVSADVVLQQSKPAATIKERIDALYNKFSISGFNINSDETSMIVTKGGAPTYGEITVESFQTLLDDLTLTDKDVFYDLGCGVGKTCVHVALVTPAKAVGIELSPTRVNHAKKVQQELIQTKQLTNPERLKFHERNIFDDPMSDATVIFLCSTCFSNDLMKNITDKIVALPQKGIRVISLKSLPEHKNLMLENTYYLPMTWSNSTPVHLYKVQKQPVLAQSKK